MNQPPEAGPEGLGSIAAEQTQAPVAPPIVTGEMAKQAPAWPKVFGVIAITLGSLVIVQSVIGTLVMGLLFPTLQKFVSAATGSSAQAKTFSTYEHWTPTIIVLAVVAAPLAGLLLAAGIGLVKCRGWAPRAAIAWSVLKIVFVLVQTGFGIAVQREQFAAMRSAPGTAAIPPGIMEAMAYAGAVVGVAWGWALPIVMLWWFNRPDVRATIANWKEREAEA